MSCSRLLLESSKFLPRKSSRLKHSGNYVWSFFIIHIFIINSKIKEGRCLNFEVNGHFITTAFYLILIVRFEELHPQLICILTTLVLTIIYKYFLSTYVSRHGLRTPSEGINQRNLKIWGPMRQTKYASAVPKNLGLGFDFRPCSEGDFLTGRRRASVVRVSRYGLRSRYLPQWYLILSIAIQKLE